jgi:alanine-synthesizing transaminase
MDSSNPQLEFEKPEKHSPSPHINNYKAADRTLYVTFAIGDVVLPARKLQKKGVEIQWLNLGDPDKFDFDTPDHIKKACKKAIDEYNGYGSSEGLFELRKAIADREKNKNNISISPEDVIVTNGTSESILIMYGAILNPGDEILIPDPAYPPYISLARFFNAIPVPYKTVEEENWEPDIDDIESKITQNTKAMLMINPNNPTGAVYRRSLLKAMGNLAAEHNIIVLSDEIYDTMTFEDHYSPSFIKDLPVIITNGISKAYLATGWRIGWTIFKDYNDALATIKEACLKQVRLRISANTVMQKASVAALNGPQDHIETVRENLRERRDYIYKRLNEIEGISTQKPAGAFYIFPKIENEEDDKKFVLDVLDKAHVLFVHGSGFGAAGKGHFRSIFLPPVKQLEKAMDALQDYMRSRAP